MLADFTRIWYFRTVDVGARELWYCAFSKVCSVGFMGDLHTSLKNGRGARITSKASKLFAKEEEKQTRKSGPDTFSFGEN